MPTQVAIDGPVASGKSTVARKLADRLGFVFLDTGALYRAVAHLALERGVEPTDESAVETLVAEHQPEVIVERRNPLTYRIRIDGKLLGQELFTLPVSQAVSPIAAMPRVRWRLIGAQRGFAEGRDVVMAGRDIGTVVLPAASFKFYLTASIDARVDRRLRELTALGVTIDRDTLREEISARDGRDMTRAVSPLIKADDALEVDTSSMTVDQVVERLERAIRSTRTGASDALYVAVQHVLRPITRALFAARVSGADNVPKAGGLVVASNHVSYLDPPILGTWFPRVIHYMAKQELFRIPVLGALMRAVHAFPVYREVGDRRAIRHALAVLRAGGVVGIFPEGRRNLSGEAQARSGAVLLAATAHCPVVPAALIRTHLAARRLRASRVEVRIGTPMRFQGSARKPTKPELAAWTQALTKAIADLMESNADPESTDSGILLRR